MYGKNCAIGMAAMCAVGTKCESSFSTEQKKEITAVWEIEVSTKVRDNKVTLYLDKKRPFDGINAKNVTTETLALLHAMSRTFKDRMDDVYNYLLNYAPVYDTEQMFNVDIYYRNIETGLLIGNTTRIFKVTVGIEKREITEQVFKKPEDFSESNLCSEFAGRITVSVNGKEQKYIFAKGI